MNEDAKDMAERASLGLVEAAEDARVEWAQMRATAAVGWAVLALAHIMAERASTQSACTCGATRDCSCA